MITKKVIETLYKKYAKLPKSPDCLDFILLFDSVADHHGINIDIENDTMQIGSIDPASPFHRIPLSRIHAIVPFEEWVAIVLHSSIIFLNKSNNKVSIHIKEPDLSLWDRVQMWWHGA
ncbi:MAG: hypothetical protein K2L80_03665 [Muribaculaceae bacterium]|nr:hypothetical protein [Muribaculaceae bacterium]MDE6331678.1 hypothetical protein [Muribaculaceae bacterium]